ncbi:large ribosomal subunit protein mL40 [Phlebotomus argentipes]|uniref:large ribosomal subunit protein mL40 n=1 Tax=Phlebotomus argentipes TaxID=94469 RepID=UPI002892A8A2|nr:large ribosomal subunit protein mL40 [Phlebotomus argentipes]
MFLSRSSNRLWSCSHLLKYTLRADPQASTRFFNSTPVLMAEPLKKKKRLDPMVIKQREERRKRKIEKQIRRLEKNARQLKPIDELEVPFTLIDEKKERTRPSVALSAEVLEERALLQKEWARYKGHQKLTYYQEIDRMVQAQTKALDELKLESEELYEAAIQPDAQILPFKSRVLVSTPPIENYESPDGEYVDVSKKWI